MFFPALEAHTIGKAAQSVPKLSRVHSGGTKVSVTVPSIAHLQGGGKPPVGRLPLRCYNGPT